MLRFALDQLTTKIIIYVSDRYKTEEMCDKSILENGRALEFVVDCCKNQKMCNKAVDNYAPAIEFWPRLL